MVNHITTFGLVIIWFISILFCKKRNYLLLIVSRLLSGLIGGRLENILRVRGKTDINDFEEFFGLEPTDKDIATVGGLFLSHSEQLPNEGEKITIEGLEVTVSELDNRRIESIIVKKIAKK